MTPEQIHLVQNSYNKIDANSVETGRLFYQHLFTLNPELKKLFSVDIEAQSKKLMTVISTTVDSLNNIDTLTPIIKNLGRRHMRYGVVSADYDTVETALLWALEQTLQQEFSSDVRAAWLDTYRILSSIMRDLENEDI